MSFNIQGFYDEVYGSGVDESSTTTNTVSVFDVGYIASSKAASLTKLQTGYFSLGTRKADMPSTEGSQASENFWKILITNITEGHAEKSLVHNTLSENVSVFAAGAMPVQISITGMLLRTATDNNHFEFLVQYVNALRARKLNKEDRTCTFVSKDTSFNLIIEALVLETSVENEAYINISIQGHAYGYKMTNSKDSLQLGYYGTTSSVPTSAVKKEEQIEKQEAEALQSASDPETSLKPVGDEAPASTQPRETIRA